MKQLPFAATAVALFVSCAANTVTSPQGDITVKVRDNAMVVCYQGKNVETVSMQSGALVEKTRPTRINESYDLLEGKRLHCRNSAYGRIFGMEFCKLEVRAYDDGVAYRFIDSYPATLSRYPENGLVEFSDGVFGFFTESDFFMEPSDNGWKIIVIGDASDIVESTLVTDIRHDMSDSCEEYDAGWYISESFHDNGKSPLNTWAHRLALHVVCEPGSPYMPDRQSAYYAQCLEAEEFIRTYPDTWDDTRLLSGYPGDHLVIARLKGNRWYIAGINETDSLRTLTFDLTKIGLREPVAATFIDGSYGDNIIPATHALLNGKMNVLPHGGFVAVVSTK